MGEGLEDEQGTCSLRDGITPGDARQGCIKSSSPNKRGSNANAFRAAQGGVRRYTCHRMNHLQVTAASRQRARARSGPQDETVGARDQVPTPSHGTETRVTPLWEIRVSPLSQPYKPPAAASPLRREAQRPFHAASSCLPTSLLLSSCSADSTQLAHSEHSPFLRLGFGAGISLAAFWTLAKPSNVVRDAPSLMLPPASPNCF